MNAKSTQLIAQWIRPQVRALSAYHVPEVGNLIKLDAMENPYTWPTPLVDAWLEVLRNVSLNRYPDPQARDLKARLRTTLQIPQDMDIMLGNGSDELIQIIAMAVAAPGRVVLSPEPSFSMYRMISAFAGLEFVGVPLNANDYSLDMPAMREAIIQRRPAVVFLSHPNNPTGNLFDEQQVCELIEISPGLVVVDEAYNAFADSTVMPRLAQYDNLLVLRTLSKMGLAGLRMGVLAGSPAWLNELDKIRLPYNISVLTQASAEFALRHYDVLEAQAAKLRDNREQLLAALRVLGTMSKCGGDVQEPPLNGITVYPSRANFILFRVPAGHARRIFESIKAQGVLIKSMHGASALLADCLRVTVGTPEENQAFLKALEHAL
jgi:histidinol-phosphate aminotransferase